MDIKRLEALEREAAAEPKLAPVSDPGPGVEITEELIDAEMVRRGHARYLGGFVGDKPNVKPTHLPADPDDWRHHSEVDGWYQRRRASVRAQLEAFEGSRAFLREGLDAINARRALLKVNIGSLRTAADALRGHGVLLAKRYKKRLVNKSRGQRTATIRAEEAEARARARLANGDKKSAVIEEVAKELNVAGSTIRDRLRRNTIGS